MQHRQPGVCVLTSMTQSPRAMQHAPYSHGHCEEGAEQRVSPFFHRRKLFCVAGRTRARSMVSRRASTPGLSLTTWHAPLAQPSAPARLAWPLQTACRRACISRSAYRSVRDVCGNPVQRFSRVGEDEGLDGCRGALPRELPLDTCQGLGFKAYWSWQLLPAQRMQLPVRPPWPSPFSMAQQSRSLAASPHIASTNRMRTASDAMGRAIPWYSDTQQCICCERGRSLG